MKNNFSLTFRLILLAVAMSMALSGVSRAVDPIPDWKTLIFPTMVPKAGNTAAETTAINFSSGTIRTDYEQRYEKYWKETSYYDYDQTSGANIRGYFNDTKTYGYTAIPWPIRPRDAAATGGGSLAGEVFRDDRQRTYMTYNDTDTNDRFGRQWYFGDACLNDGVWTPGESFFDANANGKWDPRVPAEDYWNSDSWLTAGAPDSFLQGRNTSGVKTGELDVSADGRFSVNGGGVGISLGNYNNTSVNGAFWRPDAGEVFVDWNDSFATDIALNRPGYSRTVQLYYYNGAVQVQRAVNELDFFPTDPAHAFAGDMNHTVVADPELGGVAPANVPTNGLFDFTVTAALVPQIFATGDYVEYDAFVISNAAANARGYYRYSEKWPFAGVPAASSNNTVGIGTIRAFVYGTRELYGISRGSGTLGTQRWGDQGGNPLPGRIVAADNTWTDQTPGEKFEDFISYRNGGGQMIFLNGKAFTNGPVIVGTNYGQIGTGGNNNIGRGRPATIGWVAYEAYLRWNYPNLAGGITGLLQRAYNGRYDGPEDWSESFNKKFTPSDGGNTVLAPDSFFDPLHWSDITAGIAVPDFATWYSLTFSSNALAAPGFPGKVQNINAYNAVNSTGAAEWKPVSTWSYDSPTEVCDLPSSIYHLGGNALNGVTFVGNPWLWVSSVNAAGNTVPMVLNGTNYVGSMLGGDLAMGEMTSPWSDSINGHDLWSAIPSGPAGPDQTVSSGGPFGINTIAVNGFDGADMSAIEVTTRRTNLDPTDPNSIHPMQFRDTNLDGISDRGNSRTGDPFYNAGPTGGAGDGSGAYPFNRQRFMEDVIATWDYHEDFGLLGVPAFGAPWASLLYCFPIYQAEENPGWAALGGPAGANQQILTLDSTVPLGVVFQVRPMGGGLSEGGGNGGGTVGPTNASSDFGMAILCHEQGHDIQGWPDLYDYDVWSVVGGLIVNTPIAGYDLMSGGGLVHGIADMKLTAGWLNGVIDLSTILTVGGGPVTLNLYPVDRFEDQYFTYNNPARPYQEFFDLWYTANDTSYGVVGGRGLYITHQDFGAYANAQPVQQRVNGHFTWEMLQADGLNNLQDAVNFGDGGDPWPGTTGNRVFTADGNPASRWWDQSDTGLRILDVIIPASPALPAQITFELYDPTGPWPWLYSFADADGDGIPDAWELHYFADLTTANGSTDYDRDGLLDVTEYMAGTDPLHRYSADLAQIIDDSLFDSDGDGLVNIDEQILKTSPMLPDTDDDNISDGREIELGLNPTNSLEPLIDRVLDVTAGTTNYLTLQSGYNPYASSMPLALDSFTIEAWVHPRSNNVASDIISRRLNAVSSYYNYRLMIQTNRLLALSFSRADATGTATIIAPAYTALPLNQWSHVGGSFDLTTGRLSLHINGQLVAWMYTSGRPMKGDTPVSPGGPLVSQVDHFVGLNFEGMIDEVRVWTNYPGDRTITELKQVLAGNETGLLTYHRFDDGTNSNGVSGVTSDDTGQVENYVFSSDWWSGWIHAASLRGTAKIIIAPIGAPVIAGASDTDLDGLPNWWEIQYGLSANDGSGANGTWGDADGDGLNNRAEFLAGTDPNRFDTAALGIPDYYQTNSSGLTYGELYDDGDMISDDYEEQHIGAMSPLMYDSNLDPDFDGWDNFSEYKANTDPGSAQDFPQPQVNITVKYGGTNINGTLLFRAYHSASMDGQYDAAGAAGPTRTINNDVLEIVNTKNRVQFGSNDQIGQVLANAPIAPGSVVINFYTPAPFRVIYLTFVDDGQGGLTSVNIAPARFGTVNYATGAWTLRSAPTTPATNDSIEANYSYFIPPNNLPFDGAIGIIDGSLRQGKNWFFLWSDVDGNNTYDVGEPASVSENNPVDLQYKGPVKLEFNMTDGSGLTGLPRLSWDGSLSGDITTVKIVRTSSAGVPVVLSRSALQSRSYFHEGDYYYAGTNGMYGLDAGSSLKPTYSAYITGGTNTIVRNFSFDWSSPLSRPVAIMPNGAPIIYAVNQLVWTQDMLTTKNILEIRSGSTNGTVVFNSPMIPPPRDMDGLYRINFPHFPGSTNMPNGNYYWRVTAANPSQTSLPSIWAQFNVDLQDNPVGAYKISGNIAYYGKITNAVVVVQVYHNGDFSGALEAQIELAPGITNFTIKGLVASTNFVRAFIDQNGNKELDTWESWGFIRPGSMFDIEANPQEQIVPPHLTEKKILISPRDTDNDGLADDWEYYRFGQLAVANSMSDFDGDLLLDINEYARNTNPGLADSDGDGLSDGVEVLITLSNPLVIDSDGDGLTDAFEFTLSHTNPNNGDQDGDGYWDALEVLSGTSPSNAAAYPSNTYLLGITAIMPGATQDVVTYNRAPLITSIQYRVNAVLEVKTNLIGGAWLEIIASKRTLYTTNWMSGPWSYTNAHPLSATSLFYNVKWSVPYP